MIPAPTTTTSKVSRSTDAVSERLQEQGADLLCFLTLFKDETWEKLKEPKPLGDLEWKEKIRFPEGKMCALTGFEERGEEKWEIASISFFVPFGLYQKCQQPPSQNDLFPNNSTGF